MAVSDITRDELVPLLLSPAPLATYRIAGDRVRARVVAFYQYIFSTLLILNTYPSWSVCHTLIFSTINVKELIMQHEKFHIYTLKPNSIFWHCKKNYYF